jgi:hypothetical protein
VSQVERMDDVKPQWDTYCIYNYYIATYIALLCTVSDLRCEVCIVCSVLRLTASVFISCCLPLTMCMSDA